MRLYTALKHYIHCLNDNDIRVYTNPSISKAAYSIQDTDGSIYSYDYNNITGYTGIGIAYSTNKRVFIFGTETDFSSDISMILQLSNSKLKNVFYILFDTKEHGECSIMSPINGVYGLKGVLFNLGVIVQDYSSFLKSNRPSIHGMVNNVIGPMVTVLSVDKQKSNYEEIPKERFSTYRFNKYINIQNTGTSLFGLGGSED